MADQQAARVFAFCGYELDEKRFELRQGTRRVDAQPKVLKLLFHLVEHRERVVPAEELLRTLWPDERVTIASIRRAVSGARRALGDAADPESIIRAVNGFGYQFTALVAEQWALPTPRPPAPPVTESSRAPLEDVFVGREGPIALLESSLAETKGGQGRVVLISGSPGIGKSRLVHEFAARTRSRGIETLSGRCMEAEGAPALWPWLQVLRSYASKRERAEVATMMGGGVADIAQAVPELGEWLSGVPVPPRIESAHARFRFFDSVVAFLRRAAERSGLVLAFDDLQRADAQTLRLLIFLTKQLEDSRILLIGTFRALDAMTVEPALLTELMHEDPTRCIELNGLTRDDVARYALLTIGAAPPASAVDTLHRQTAGNPLFCAQIIHTLHLEARHDAAPDWPELDRIPRSLGLRAAIDRHLQVLARECRVLLRSAAVQGREFDIALLEQALRQDPALLQHLSEAMHAGIVHERGVGFGHYAFTHVLIRDALYEELPAPRRAELHAGVGAALEAQGAATIDRHLALLAHHFLQAAPAHDAGRALEYARRAGGYAMKHLAFEEAALHFQAALRLLPHGERDLRQRFELLMARGEALRHARDDGACRETLVDAAALARTLDCDEAITRVALEFGRHFNTGRVDAERVGLLRQALGRLPADDRRRPLLEGQLARSLLFSGDLAERTGLARQALAGALRSNHPAIAAETFQFCHEALLEPQHLQERRAISDELIRLAQRHAEDEWLLYGGVTQVLDYLTLGDMSSVDVAIRTTEALATKVRQPLFRWYCLVFRGTRASLAGEFELAERIAHEALRFGPYVGEDNAYHSYCCQLSMVLNWRGRLAELEPLLRDISSRYPALAGWRAVLATVEAQQGRTDRARSTLAELLADDMRAIHAEPYVLAALAPTAGLCALVGDSAQAQVLYDAMLPYADLHGVVALGMSHHGPIARHLGLLALLLRKPARARQHFEQALRMAEQMLSPPFIGLTSLQLGQVLAASKSAPDQERARALYARAASLGQAHALSWLTQMATKALGALAHGQGRSRQQKA